MKDRVAKRHVNNKTQLKEILLQEWKKIDADITRHVHKMLEMMRSNIQRKGLIAKY